MAGRAQVARVEETERRVYQNIVFVLRMIPLPGRGKLGPALAGDSDDCTQRERY